MVTDLLSAIRRVWVCLVEMDRGHPFDFRVSFRPIVGHGKTLGTCPTRLSLAGHYAVIVHYFTTGASGCSRARDWKSSMTRLETQLRDQRRLDQCRGLITASRNHARGRFVLVRTRETTINHQLSGR